MLWSQRNRNADKVGVEIIKFARENPEVVATVLAAIIVPIIIPIILEGVGFGTAGVTAGTFAASSVMMPR